jgi:hypothetical protein
MHRIARLLAVLVAAACTLVPDNLDAPPKGGAVILATVTMGHSGPFSERIGFVLRDGDGKRFRLDSAVPETPYPMLESTPDEGLEKENGLLIAIVRTAGEFRIEDVRIYSVPAIDARLTEPVTFHAAEGETVYIGNLHVELCHLRSAGEPYYVAGGHPSATDRWERDGPLLLAKFPWLAGRAVVHRIPDDRALREGARDLYAKCP